MMNTEYKVYIYAFLSRVMSDMPDTRFISDLKNNSDLLETIGQDTTDWILSHNEETLKNELNADFSSLFLLHSQPIESFILDAKNESLVGLQNPVMLFYFQHGFEINMDQTQLMAPDHLSLEFAFMQTLVQRDEKKVQFEFLDQHLMNWVIPFMLGMKSSASTPFYRDICDLIAEFLSSEYDYLKTLELSNFQEDTHEKKQNSERN
jgi:putative dimethyl sulfoxide reductase chaperone